ncbi:MAG: exosortase family protein XrtF [Flavobacteriaceae bacterium]|nr:exosortase family protein XrtF [Flavobacteriaceae bacterium]
MKTLVKKYKSVIRFILTFLLVYGGLSLTYKLYLDMSQEKDYHPDYITNLISRQCQVLLESLGHEAQVIPHDGEASIKLILNDEYVARVIEGCNGVSAIILFSAFVIAFSWHWKATVLYVFTGAVVIYAVNLMRIVVLALGLYYYPTERDLLHGVIFPMIIYGMVFLLWMLWVNRFKKINKKYVV